MIYLITSEHPLDSSGIMIHSYTLDKVEAETIVNKLNDRPRGKHIHRREYSFQEVEHHKE